MIQFQAVRFSIGGRLLLDEASFTVPERERAGLIGRNGAGKTTILRLILGELRPDDGEVSRPRASAVGYLPQRPAADARDALLPFVLSGDPRIGDLESRIAGLEARLVSETDPRVIAGVSEAHAKCIAEYEARGGPKRAGRAEAILKGLGFGSEAFDRPVASLSGGEKSRAALARLLLQDPEILLLDEPTNHLDVAMIAWLEGWLAGLSRTVIAISHDRYFLNAVATRILDLESASIGVFPGNYDAYREEKARRVLERRRAYDRQREEIRRNEDFIRRNIAGQNTRQAQSRRRMLARMERLERPPDELDGPAIRFDRIPPAGDRVLRADGIEKRFGDRVILRGVSLELERGERLAIVGPNGTGKTTLLRILAGRLAADGGTVVPGPRTRIGYFDQELRELPLDATAFSFIHDRMPGWTNQEVRDFLARFLFRNGRVFSRLGDLSGGERSLAALARLIVDGHNLLLLDEPTNHLDIAARGALEDALAAYPESVVFVTHDRYLVDRLATRLLVVDREGVRGFVGNWTELVRAQASPGGRRREAERSRPEGKPRGRPGAEIRQLRRRIERIEREIEAREADLGAAREASGREENWRDPERMRALKRSIARLEEELRPLYGEWEALVDALPSEPGQGGAG
ncbi:MAG: ABC-F family ATP-binding cassette domain-containing protein [Planctomycetes bacterium]|nr:ABC-F family ATP-binding cassette domain-containing protein [Planctomycetota bacterium]